MIQEVVNRPGWASGNAIAIIITGTGKRVATSFDGYMHGAPYLHIQYTLPTVTPTPTYTPTLIPTITLTPSRTLTPTATVPSSFSGATFVYDGDGKRVKSIFNGTTTTYFVGAHYEMTGSTVTKYYYAGAQRIAMRAGGTLNYLLGDHLGSTSLTTSATGTVISELRYKAWGEVRYASGTTLTKYTFTGQYSHVSDFGLMFYNARWYDVSIGRFASADTIVANGVQATDRYVYSNNNPLRYADPTGHIAVQDGGGCPTCNFPKRTYYTWWAQRYGDKSGGYMQTYAIAGIGVQNPYWPPRSILGGLPRTDVGPKGGPYTGVGPAKVTDKEMEYDYGAEIYDDQGDFRGIGLGMAGKDQTKGKIAVEAMMLRIQLRTEACDDKCTSTDIFLAAALGQNGPNFNPGDIELLMHGDAYGPRPKNTTNSLDWAKFLEGLDEAENNRKLIAQFAGNVLYLDKKGWDVPNDIDWEYVYSLTVTTEQQ